KDIRKRVARASHAELNLSTKRDPLGILQAADADRIPELVPIRYGRMLVSPFAFYRGAAGVMAADLAHTPVTGVAVQACGDCHLKNFGGFATPERNIVFDINDFDETLPAPWEWDVKRLAASFVLAVRENGLSGRVARQVTVTCVETYRETIREFAGFDPLAVWYAKLNAEDFLARIPASDRARVERRIGKVAAKRGADVDYPRLAEVVGGETRIHDSPPLIFHPEVARTPDFAQQVGAILNEYRESLPHDRRVLFDRYQFVDAAIKVVGIGSVGTRCWIALLMSPANEPLFLQFKQAHASVLEPYAEKSAYAHHGQRVVMGQRLMQAASDIFLGWTTGPSGDFYVRQLRDAKISASVESFDAGLFEAYARGCGWNLARAHAKSGNARIVGGYLGKSDEFDEAVAEFATAYADVTERDHAALRTAVRDGRIDAYVE
ncbi:MAG TPA: DUF2252 domain-containing protein, partial [Candidatus Cybelea sp.]|nr:DUF2252 domain-containing protein [Candidatus Cybelea sp.]